MESVITQTINDVSNLFNIKIKEFEEELKTVAAGASSSSAIDKLTQEFNAFKTFILFAVQNLHAQVQMLLNKTDDLEMRSRKKILLVHGLQEDKKEDISASVASFISKKLQLANVDAAAFSRCHRMGRFHNADKPRPVIIKFKDISMRDTVWNSKSKLKGTGVTLSEFLTKMRHDTFKAAHQRFGVSRCWTRNGSIIVVGADSTRHSVVDMAGLNAIAVPAEKPAPAPSTSKVVSMRDVLESDVDLPQRTRRGVKANK